MKNYTALFSGDISVPQLTLEFSQSSDGLATAYIERTMHHLFPVIWRADIFEGKSRHVATMRAKASLPAIIHYE